MLWAVSVFFGFFYILKGLSSLNKLIFRFLPLLIFTTKLFSANFQYILPYLLLFQAYNNMTEKFEKFGF